MIVLIIVAAILVIMGIIILIGKGDNLIAGYNTASKEERRYDWPESTIIPSTTKNEEFHFVLHSTFRNFGWRRSYLALGNKKKKRIFLLIALVFS